MDKGCETPGSVKLVSEDISDIKDATDPSVTIYARVKFRKFNYPADTGR